MMLRFMILSVFLCALLIAAESMLYTKCGPVCQIYCKYGNELDKNGCPMCQCKKKPNQSSSPCKDGQPPLEGYYCGWGPNRQDCPSTYTCVISVDDAYAVCCPPHQEIIV